MCVCVCVCVCEREREREREREEYNIISIQFLLFEVLTCILLLIFQSTVCSPLSVRYGAIEMIAIIMIIIIIRDQL